ncbi:hypothetical protein ACTD5D_39790 [Nocardia takedensis]|uniref:hypothetical protein n=1 Tax=Nocardia takedensis TaxID=259390 RepID=UPI003F7673DF
MSGERLRMRRRGGFDDGGNATAPGPASWIIAHAVQPGTSEEYRDLGRDGETVEYTVYFVPAPPVLSDDHELFVRGAWYAVRTQDWRSPYGTGRSGLVAVCSAGRG